MTANCTSQGVVARSYLLDGFRRSIVRHVPAAAHLTFDAEVTSYGFDGNVRRGDRRRHCVTTSTSFSWQVAESDEYTLRREYTKLHSLLQPSHAMGR